MEKGRDEVKKKIVGNKIKTTLENPQLDNSIKNPIYKKLELLDCHQSVLNENEELKTNKMKEISELKDPKIEKPLKDLTDTRISRIIECLRSVKNENEKDARETNSGFIDHSPTKSSHLLEDVKGKLMRQQMEIEENSRTILFLKKEVKRYKDTIKELETSHSSEMKSKLSLQRKEYEATINRHLSFIDKVIAEKEELSRKCEQLIEQSKELETSFKSKLSSKEEFYMRDLKQKKEMWENQEKIKRDKWIAEKTKNIKEQTIKGLEPEIQKMIANHQQQLKAVEEKCKSDYEKNRAILVDQHQHQIEEYRDKIATERRRAAEEEREFARQRYAKTLERDEMEFQQAKRKLLMDFEEQKDQIYASFKEERKKEEAMWKKIIDESKRQYESLKLNHSDAIETLKKKHGETLMMINKDHEENILMAERRISEKCNLELVEKEKLIKEKLAEERDREIELVIRKLESETYANSSDTIQRHRLDIERIKGEHLEQIKLLRDQSNMALDKVLSLQQELQKIEETNNQLKRKIIELEHESLSKGNVISEQKEQISRLNQNEAVRKETIKLEFQTSLNQKNAELHTIRRDLENHNATISEIRRQYEYEIEEIKRKKDQDFKMVEEEVREALKFRDQTIEDLKDKIKEFTLKCNLLENIIDKQRKEIVEG